MIRYHEELARSLARVITCGVDVQSDWRIFKAVLDSRGAYFDMKFEGARGGDGSDNGEGVALALDDLLGQRNLSHLAVDVDLANRVDSESASG